MSGRLYHLAAVSFEAARRIDSLPSDHRLRNLHGHSFLARVRALLPAGWTGFPGTEVETLTGHLARCVEPLDYGLLNDFIQVPTDESLARWVVERLDIPGIEMVGIQSTRDQGIDLTRGDHPHIWRRFRFEAAHQLPYVAAGHPCGRMHGHGFEVILHAAGGSPEQGIDFHHLEACWAPLQARLHYACLNDLPGLENPTSERLAEWIWRRLKAELPSLSWVTVYETTTAGCHYDGVHYRIWKEQRFESALRLNRVAEDDPRRRLHGHSYRVRLHLTASLDAVMGWTVDYGDVKALFQPVYQAMDHHRLDQLPGIEDADSGSVLRWIRTTMAERLPLLDRIDLYQTPDCGASLCWNDPGSALPVW